MNYLTQLHKLAYLRFKRSSTFLNKTADKINNDELSDEDRLRREIDLNRALISKDEFNEIKYQYDLIISEDIDVVLNNLKNL